MYTEKLCDNDSSMTVSIPFILILQLSSHFLLLNIIKLVIYIFKESLFA